MSETLSALISTTRRGKVKPALYVGLVAHAPHTPSQRVSLANIAYVDIERGDARVIERREVDGSERLHVALADPRMSSKHARITRVGREWILEDRGSKNGTFIGRTRVTRRTLEDGDTIVVGHTALVFRTSGGELGDEVPGVAPLGLATMQPALAAAFAQLAVAAKSTVPIEITGETGTGKELVARAVHELSGRRGHFVAVNCGALATTILEAELFGYRRGAFTGANEDRLGLVRSAHQGTLFLDEVAELPAGSQATLLRVLQEGEVQPLGGERPVKVDLRIVTATHRDVDGEVAAGKFRPDLRARLLGLAMPLPPVRERPEDLALLISSLLQRLAPDRAVTFSSDTVAALYAYEWPLNVRELERALAVALVIAGELVELHHLPHVIRVDPDAAPVVDVAELSDEDRVLRDQLANAVARHEGNLAAVARELGKDRTQIRRWMKRLGLSRDDE